MSPIPVIFRIILSACPLSMASFALAEVTSPGRPPVEKSAAPVQPTQEVTPGSSSSDTVAPVSAPPQIATMLRQRLPQVDIGAPELLPFPGIVQVKVGSRYLYVTDDGRYAFVGDLVDLQSGINITNTRRNRDNLALINTFPEKDMVVYPASHEEQARITVFTDPSCPYCRKLHEEVPQLQKAGVTVRYIAFPRAGAQGDAYRTMRMVWCADNRRSAMDAAKGAGLVDQQTVDCEAANAVDAGYQLGQRMGIRGTPAIVLPDGEIQPGYLPVSQILAQLGLIKESDQLGSLRSNR